MGTGIVVLLWALGIGAAPAEVYTARSHTIAIPIRVNEAKRADLKELELHVSTDQGRTWTLMTRVNPDQMEFTFHAPNDGLYWFGVSAVDKAGSRDPVEFSATSPGILKVLIDTVSPVLRIATAERVGDEIQVAWDTQDAQADPTSLQLKYRATDGSIDWQRVPVNPALNGQAHFRPQINGPITICLQINDSTGTPATAVKDLPAPLGGASPNVPPITPAPVLAPVMTPPTNPVPPPTANAAPPPPQAPAIQQTNSIAPPPPIPTAPLGQAPSLVGHVPQPVPAAETPVPMPAAQTPLAPQGSLNPQMPLTPQAVPAGPPMPPAPTPAAPTPAEPAPGLTPLAPRSNADAAPRGPSLNGVPDFANLAPQPRTMPSDVQHVRDRQVAIDFEVERKGPSGVKRIQVFITPDDGRTWYSYYVTDQTTSPMQLPLPEEEGLYGFRLVLFSGADQSLGPPHSGDAPDIRLQVDRTKPKVAIYPPTIAPGQPNALVLNYAVSDAHLDLASVKLYWSVQPQGKWEPIGAGNPRASSIDRNLKDLKECTWSLPADLPDRVYLRLTATDLAGNEGEFVTRDPVTVDLHKPTARIKSVAGIGGR